MSTTDTRHPASTLQPRTPVNPMWGGLHQGDIVTAIVQKSEHDDAYNVAGQTRRCMITGEADTWFSIPARCSIAGRKVPGYVTTATDPDDPEGSVYTFHAYLYGAGYEAMLARRAARK